MCMYVLFMQIDNSIHNRVFYRHNAWPNTLKSRLHMDSSDLYNVKNYSMPCRTFCVSGLCTRNVTTLITVTSKVTLQIPRVQCSGWHFPRASSRPRQVRLRPFHTFPSRASVSFPDSSEDFAVKFSPVLKVSACPPVISFCGY